VSDFFEKTIALITPSPTDIWGLKFFPNMEPHINNNRDAPVFGSPSDQEVTVENQNVVREVVTSFGDNLHAIIEIGVNRNGENSMSQILIHNRPRGSFYLGIDIDDKSYLNNLEENTWTIQCNSLEQDKIRQFLSEKCIDSIDILLIDGDHSVNACINDWKYSNMLRKGGVVIMHDTTAHPGPIGLFEAIDENIFNKQRLCTKADHGIGIARRI